MEYGEKSVKAQRERAIERRKQFAVKKHVNFKKQPSIDVKIN